MARRIPESATCADIESALPLLAGLVLVDKGWLILSQVAFVSAHPIPGGLRNVISACYLLDASPQATV